MSAFCFVVGDDKISICSDGISYNTKKRKVVDTEKSKIYPLFDSVAMIWIGAFFQWAPPLVKSIRQNGRTDPEYIAYKTGRTMEDWFSQTGKMHLLDEAKELNTGYYIYVVGYSAAGFPELYMLESINKNRFVPQSFDLKPGWVEFQAHNHSTADTAFQELFNYNYKIYQDLEHANREAFRSVIDDLENEDVPVGGKIFTEMIKAV